jgi:hypothetical protein
MKHRSPLAVFFLSLFTLGIYALVWQVKTKGELNRLGANIPTAWLIIVPFANLYWIWKYAEGVEKVTNGKISAVMALILLLLLSIVGIAILQNLYNNPENVPLAAATPGAVPAPAAGVPEPTPPPSPMPPQQTPNPPATPPSPPPPAPTVGG